MKRLLTLLILLVSAVSGCAMLGTPGSKAAPPTTLIAQTAQLVKEHKFAQAVAEYRRILHNFPDTEAAAQAKYGIAMVYVNAENPQRDYAIAIAELDEFIAQYPRDSRAEEARNWRQALKVLLDARKENDRLNRSIEKLKQLDMRQEEKRLGK